MFLQSKKLKYQKTKKGKIRKLEFKTNKLQFGNIGLKAINSAIITSKQIEAIRQIILKNLNKKGKIWIRVFPNLFITSKPISGRMGKGKGSFSHWGVRIKGGTILLEIGGVKNFNIINNVLKTGRVKLPIKTKIIQN